MTCNLEFSFDLDRLLKEISNCNRVLVYGGMDTGKTTLVKTLFERLRGKVLDGDLGQPEIGPPGLISLGTYDHGMEDAYFVGDFTPRGNLVQVMTGISRLLPDKPTSCLIDTDGWIEGDAARVYKGELISLVKPDKLLLLEEENELENFATFLPEKRVISLDASHSGSKSRGERAANRQKKLKRYFYRLERLQRDWEEIRVGGTGLGRGKRIPAKQLKSNYSDKVLAAWQIGEKLTLLSERRIDKDSSHKDSAKTNKTVYPVKNLKYRLIGCYHDLIFQGMGIITEIDSRGLEVLVPGNEFNMIKLGKKRVKPSGRTLPN
ncbi:hypothetical protein K9M06_00490 [Candidatus Bipolaricaulota bacterium]|nr:hypothetical protein [Candidatus Bipolaricaulota bacterium]